MDVSVIICTFNRCEDLRRTLEAFCRLVLPRGFTWELVVVDNNSNDATRPVVEEFIGRSPLRYIFEPRQGKSCALNRAIAETSSPLLVFTDDDVDVDANWVAEIVAAAKRNPDASFFGGKVIPHWEKPPPRWLAENERSLLASVAVSYDLGGYERTIKRFEPGKEVPFLGANLAVRRRVFEDGMRFREDIGPNAAEPTRGEETELMERIMARGGKGLYVPGAIVYHRNSARRMTEKYIREWYKGAGMIEVRQGEVALGRLWFGAPRWAYRSLLVYGLRYACTRLTRPSSVWLLAEIKMATAWGVICEARRNVGMSTS